MSGTQQRNLVYSRVISYFDRFRLITTDLNRDVEQDYMGKLFTHNFYNTNRVPERV